jgi:hypothetical protein
MHQLPQIKCCRESLIISENDTEALLFLGEALYFLSILSYNASIYVFLNLKFKNAAIEPIEFDFVEGSIAD